MKEEALEGIVLRSIPVREGRHILTVFTPYEGLIGVAAPRSSVHEMRQNAATALLSRSEFCIRKGRASDIYRLLEATLIESFDKLRQEYALLSAAGELIQSILRSQLAGKPAPLLFELLLTYLRRLSCTAHPHLLTISFQLKLLKHEGLFASASPSTQEYAGFSPDDRRCLALLADSRSFAEIESTSLSPYLSEKVGALFEKLIQ